MCFSRSYPVPKNELSQSKICFTNHLLIVSLPLSSVPIDSKAGHLISISRTHLERCTAPISSDLDSFV